MAARFHLGLAEAASRLARSLAASHGAKAIALSGGCFQNRTLLELMLARLDGMTVLSHEVVPANDGGVALGQAVIAAARHW